MENLDSLAGLSYEEVVKRLQEQNNHLHEELHKASVELEAAYETTIHGWSQALEMSNLEMEGHNARVTELSLRLGRAMGLDDSTLTCLRRGAMLHDVGMLGLSDRILFKSSTLDEEEQALLKQHPVTAHQLLSNIPFLCTVIDIPYCHHEAWDGSGYPRGLKGEEIPLLARIFAVIDVYDSLRHNRPHRSAWEEADVLQYIREQSGKQFDPRVVEVFLKMIG